MTPDQLQAFRDKLAQNKQPVHRGEQYSHPRGWNDCLEFVEKALREVLGESSDKT